MYPQPLRSGYDEVDPVFLDQIRTMPPPHLRFRICGTRLGWPLVLVMLAFNKSASVVLLMKRTRLRNKKLVKLARWPKVRYVIARRPSPLMCMTTKYGSGKDDEELSGMLVLNFKLQGLGGLRWRDNRDR